MRRLLDTAIVSAASLFALFTAAHGALAPADPARGVAVVFAPWTDFETAFARSVGAGARFVREGGVPFIVVVVPEDADFERRARAGGAWMLADPEAVAGCFAVLNGESRG